MLTARVRARRATVAITAALLTLTGCGGNDDDPEETDDSPSFSQPSATAADKSDEADVKAAIRDYDRALVSFNREQEVTAELEAVATDAWADQLFTTYDDNIFSNGLEMVGRWRTIVQSVSVAGDSAEARVCNDGNKVYVVDQGAGIPNGAQSQGRSTGVISLVREDDGWQVDGNAIGEGKC